MGNSNSVKQTPQKMSTLQTAANVIIVFTVVFAAFYTLGVFDEFKLKQAKIPKARRR